MILFLIALSLLGVSEALGQDHIDFFEKKIRPVMAERCYQCPLRGIGPHGNLDGEATARHPRGR